MIDILIARVAGSQYGLFCRDQWRALGGSDDQLSWRLSTGALTDEGIGVYGLPGWPECYMRSVWRMYSARSAFMPQQRKRLPRPRITFGRSRKERLCSACRTAITIDRTRRDRPSPRDLTEDQIVVVNGMRVTSIPRTFCDLAASSSRARLSRGLEQAHLDGKSKVSETVALYERLRKPGKPGFKMLGEILEVRRPDFYIPPTELEKMFRQLLRRYGLPEPIWQPPLPWDPRRRADGLWLPQNVLLELDSRSWHARIDQMTADRRRDRDAKRHGFPLYRFTYEEVKYEPRHVADEVRALLALAA